MSNVVVIAPHPDDEVLGCGGTIFNHTSRGDSVFVIVATNAALGAPELYSQKGTDFVRKEALLAHKILGVEHTVFLDFPAPALNAYPEYKISLQLSELIKKYAPDYLYLPHPGDLHQDHRAIYRAALVASRPNCGVNLVNIYCYETLSETEWSPYNEHQQFSPNHFIDITKSFDKKIEAMHCYKTQLKQSPHPRSESGILSLANYRGGIVSLDKCEAFEVERQVVQ